MERMTQERVVERYINTIWSIASSRYVQHFVIGYTSDSASRRFAQYQKNGYHYIVILEDKLSQRRAHDLEERLQNACKLQAKSGGPHCRKYHPDHRELRYFKSAGQGSPDPCAPIHSVYMAWIEPSR